MTKLRVGSLREQLSILFCFFLSAKNEVRAFCFRSWHSSIDMSFKFWSVIVSFELFCWHISLLELDYESSFAIFWYFSLLGFKLFNSSLRTRMSDLFGTSFWTRLLKFRFGIRSLHLFLCFEIWDLIRAFCLSLSFERRTWFVNSNISKFDDQKSSCGNQNSIIKVWIIQIFKTDGTMWFQESQLESGISINRDSDYKRFPFSKITLENGYLNLKCREPQRLDFTKQVQRSPLSSVSF